MEAKQSLMPPFFCAKKPRTVFLDLARKKAAPHNAHVFYSSPLSRNRREGGVKTACGQAPVALSGGTWRI